MKYRHILELAFRKSDDLTRLYRNFNTGALRVVKPFYIQDTLILQVISLGAGISSDDIFQIKIEADEGCKVILINQSATKILKSTNGNYGENKISVNLGTNSVLEFYSGLIIPFPNSMFRQTVDVNIASGARFGYLEFLSVGRIERGEEFLFGKFSNTLHIKKQNKHVFWENYSMDKSKRGNLATIGSYRYIASGIWTYHLSTEDKGLEEFNKGMIIWSKNQSGLTFIRGFAQEGYPLIRRVCNMVNEFKKIRNDPLIPWENLSSAFL